MQTELYKINENPTLPKLDKDGDSLCGENCPAGLKGANLATYNALATSMSATLTSEPSCTGDGNEDKKVNAKDVLDWFYFRHMMGYPAGTTSITMDTQTVMI